MNKKGIVYLIPTPIGNMDDLSKRIIDTLNIYENGSNYYDNSRHITLK